MPAASPVQLVSPERILYEGEAEMVVCRTIDGEIAFLHRARAVRRRARRSTRCASSSPDHGEEAAAVHGGFVEVTGDDR